MAAIAVNYSSTPAHAKQYSLWPGSGGSPCFDNRHECEQPIKDLGLTCHRKTQWEHYSIYFLSMRTYWPKISHIDLKVMIMSAALYYSSPKLKMSNSGQ